MAQGISFYVLVFHPKWHDYWLIDIHHNQIRQRMASCLAEPSHWLIQHKQIVDYTHRINLDEI